MKISRLYCAAWLWLIAKVCRVPRTEVWSHKQNLNECKCGAALPGPWWHGRGWVHIGDRKQLSVCWQFLSRRNDNFTVSLDIGGGDGDDGLDFHVAVPFLFSLWFGCEGFIKDRVTKVNGAYVDRRKDYELRYSFGGHFGPWGSLWVKCGANPMEWNASDPKWMQWSFDPCDFVLGRNKYHREKIGNPVEWPVRMPEGVYTVTMQREVATWKRPRWYKPLVKKSIDVSSLKGIPVPGKGDNSWDCGDSAILATGFNVETFQEAADGMYDAVMQTRKRHGNGVEWRPDEKFATA